MTICPRCHVEQEPGTPACPVCRVGMLEVVEIPPRHDLEWIADEEADLLEIDPDHPGDAPLRLLLEEPVPGMAAMIREFLDNNGIESVVDSNKRNLPFYLPTPLIRARVYVRDEDFDEARELIDHFFRKI